MNHWKSSSGLFWAILREMFLCQCREVWGHRGLSHSSQHQPPPLGAGCGSAEHQNLGIWVRNPLLVWQPCLGPSWLWAVPALCTGFGVLEVQEGWAEILFRASKFFSNLLSLGWAWWSQRSFPTLFILWFCDQFCGILLNFTSLCCLGLCGVRSFPGISSGMVTWTKLSVFKPPCLSCSQPPEGWHFFYFCCPGASTAPCEAPLWNPVSVGAERLKGRKRDVSALSSPPVSHG